VHSFGEKDVMMPEALKRVEARSAGQVKHHLIQLKILSLDELFACDPIKTLTAAWHNQALKHHPDRGGHAGRFVQIHNTY